MERLSAEELLKRQMEIKVKTLLQSRRKFVHPSLEFTLSYSSLFTLSYEFPEQQLLFLLVIKVDLQSSGQRLDDVKCKILSDCVTFIQITALQELMEKLKVPSDAELMKVAIADLNNSSVLLEDRHRALQELLVLVEPIDNANGKLCTCLSI